MATIPTPANLYAYYCENCHGIIVTSDTSKVSEKYGFDCPFCDDDALVLLDNDLYKNNFDYNTFPHPQNLLLKHFFTNLDNSEVLFSVFGQLNPIELTIGAVEYQPNYDYLMILINPFLDIECQLFYLDQGFTICNGSGVHLLEQLEALS